MIFGDFMKALAQLSDPRFRRVLLIGVLLSLALLVGVYAGFLWVISVFTPETIDIPTPDDAKRFYRFNIQE